MERGVNVSANPVLGSKMGSQPESLASVWRGAAGRRLGFLHLLSLALRNAPGLLRATRPAVPVLLLIRERAGAPCGSKCVSITDVFRMQRSKHRQDFWSLRARKPRDFIALGPGVSKVCFRREDTAEVSGNRGDSGDSATAFWVGTIAASSAWV